MSRLVAVVLLVLSISPLTAPFSVADSADMFGGLGTHVQAKQASDKLAVDIVPTPIVLPAFLAVMTVASLGVERVGAALHLQHQPLRL